MDKKDKRSRILYVSVLLFLCVVFVVGFFWGLNSVLAMEGSYPPNVLKDAATFLPDTREETLSADEAVAYLNKVTALALTNEAKINTSVDFNVNTDENGYIVSTDGSDKLMDTLVYLCDDVDDGDTELGAKIRADVENKEADFGGDIASVLFTPEIKASDVESVDCTYVYYQCTSCGITSEEALPECVDCGNEAPYIRKYRDDYSVTLHLKNTDEILNKAFAPREPGYIEELLSVPEADIKDAALKYDNFTVTFTADRVTDKLRSVSYRKDVLIDADAVFSGDLAQLGKAHITCSVYKQDNYYLTWPGITLNNHEMSVEQKGKDNILATLTCSDPTEMTVTWTSSDPLVVSVDEEGYFKAAKNSDGSSAIITAEYEFNGKKYSDSCVVNVRYSVESTALKKNKVKLASGETFALELKFSPSNATVKTAKWYSEDENVVTVDENGVITAVGTGSATVYSISDDGYFRSTCKVTVS